MFVNQPKFERSEEAIRKQNNNNMPDNVNLQGECGFAGNEYPLQPEGRISPTRRGCEETSGPRYINSAEGVDTECLGGSFKKYRHV